MIGLAKVAAGRGGLALVERPEPVVAAGHLVIEVTAAGVCGTDLHIEAGEYATAVPVTLGHEVSGVVAAVGAGVDPDLIGARVVCETFFSTCGRCRGCREGRPNLCPRRRSIGTHVDGGFAPLLVVPETGVHRVPDWLDSDHAVLAEPLACVCQCMLDPAAVAPGERVLVTGPGPMGILAAQVARALGGEAVVAGLPADAARLAIAAGLGFATTDDATQIEDVDVAVEASGTGGGLDACLSAVRAGGSLVQIGIFGRPVTAALDPFLLGELKLRTGFASTPRAWRRTLRLIERRDVEFGPLVSEVAPLADWERVFAQLRAGGGMKIALDPRGDAEHLQMESQLVGRDRPGRS